MKNVCLLMEILISYDMGSQSDIYSRFTDVFNHLDKPLNIIANNLSFLMEKEIESEISPIE